MSDLSPQAEALLEISRAGDDPTGRDRTRVRNALAARIALGVAAGAAVATISKTAATATAASVAAGSASTTSVAGATVATATAATATVATATVATAASTGVGAGAAAGVGISGLAAKLLLSAALVGAVGAGTVTYTQHRADETRTSSPVASFEAKRHVSPSPLVQRPPSGTKVEAQVTETTADPARSVPSVPVEALPAAPTPRVTSPVVPGPIVASPLVAPSTPVIDAPVVTTAPVEAPAKASSLTEEIALLQDAHAALQSGSAARALAVLDDHARRFPKGTLTEEREASRVSALCKLGRPDEARTQAADFLRDHPRSPQAPAVRASCAFDGKYVPGR